MPLAPEAEWIEQVRAALPMLPAARRARLAEATGRRRHGEAVAVVVERGQDDYVLAVGDGRRRRRPARSCTSRRRTPTRAPAPDRAGRRPRRLTTMETGGQLTATQAKQVLAELVADGGGDPAAIAAAKGFEAMDDSAPWRRWSTRRSPPTPAPGRSTAAGEDKAAGRPRRRRDEGQQGQADGAAVTALLRAKRS